MFLGLFDERETKLPAGGRRQLFPKPTTGGQRKACKSCMTQQFTDEEESKFKVTKHHVHHDNND